MTYRCIGLAASLDLDAQRHQARGDRYLAEGRADYAAGSYRKAEKHRRRASDLRAFLAPTPMTERFMQEVDEVLFHGSTL